jgi:RNA polymerase sigma-70 factor (ECF subfamily)
MEEGARADLERSAREACERGDFSTASALIVRGYGPEIFGFLVATHKSEQDAGDVFSDFTLAVLRGIAAFRFQSTIRTWAYAVARNASHHFRRDTGRAARKRAPASELEEIANGVRTSTLAFLRTDARTKLERMRDSLAPEDRELLILRVDKNFSWEEVALAFHEGDEPIEGVALTRASQRLRKRFQLVKDTLRDLARREGLA